MIEIRQATAADEPEVRRFFEELSTESRWKRYHSAAPRVMPWMVEPVVHPDHLTHDALIALNDGRVVGIAEWGRNEPTADTADMAIVVSEDCRRHGIAKTLVRELGRSAYRQGIATFSGSILTLNRASVALLRNVAPTSTTSFDGATIEFRAPLRVPA